MAVTKKSIEEIARENALDISEANAERVANAYIQPTLDALTRAEQVAVADAQSARKALEADYFNQYRENMYNAQSRGLSGGLANIDTNRLRMQMGQANSEISNNLLREQSSLNTQRGTALSNAKSYKTQYLNDILSKVSTLREQDYAQRYAEWEFLQKLQAQKEQQAQAQANWEKEYALSLQNFALQKEQAQIARAQAEAQNRAQEVQARAYEREYAQSILPDIVNTFLNKAQSNAKEAAAYLNSKMSELERYGYTRSEISNAINNIQKYRSATNTIDAYQQASKQQNTNKNIYGLLGGLGTGFSIGLAPMTGGLSLIGLPFGIGSYVKGFQANKNKKNYIDLYNQAQNTISNAGITIPSWYQEYLGQ